MNIKEYISSGVIESYVLNLATAEEVQELERLVMQYPEIRAALDEAQEALNAYALLHDSSPPEELRENIYEKLQAAGEIREDSKYIPVPAKGNRGLSFSIAIAASILLVMVLAFHFIRVRDLKNQIDTLETEKSQIIARNETFMSQLNNAKAEISVIENPSVTPIILAGVPGHDDKQAQLYWSRETHDVYLKLSNLPALPAGKQYQLWAIVAGKPVNAGVYQQKETAILQKMMQVRSAEMFAITIEKEGGSEIPTLDQMVVAGKI